MVVCKTCRVSRIRVVMAGVLEVPQFGLQHSLPMNLQET